MFRLGLSLRVLALVLFVGMSSALAQTSLSDPLARELKQSGDAAMVEGRYGDALDAYQRATAVEPHPSLLYNRARALSGLGRHAEALEHFEAFARDAPAELKALVPQLDELLQTARSHVVELDLSGGKPGARVFVEGRPIATLPLDRPLRVDEGDVNVRVVAEGYEDFEQRLRLVGGTVERIRILQRERSTRGLLRVESEVRGAEVVIDQRAMGVVPFETRLAAGAHTVLLRHPGYESAETRVVLAVDEKKRLLLSLEKKPAFYENVWFWGGVGLLVAGGVVTTIALTTERAPDRGDIDPGTIRTALSF